MKTEFMLKALTEAKKAYIKNEVPIGAIIVKDGKVIAKAHNKRQTKKLATAHAEILAIQKACKKIKDWRLSGCDIYVTLEPCPMCIGAIINARMRNVIFGAYETTSKTDLLNLIVNDKRLNHTLDIEGGVLENECSELLKQYFKDKRKASKYKK